MGKVILRSINNRIAVQVNLLFKNGFQYYSRKTCVLTTLEVVQ